MSTDSEKISRAISDVEASLVSACKLREQWRAATQYNPKNLTKKEVDQTEKTLKNKLLTVKWDCEDLEELIDHNQEGTNEVIELAKKCIEQSRVNILDIMNELEGAESRSRMLNKHGISLQNTAQAAISSLTNNQSSSSDKYERLLNDGDGDVVFDRNQIESNVYNNQLHDYYEYEESYKNKNGFKSTEVFNNLTKPLTSVQTSTNDHETILGMLETEYYEPPQGLLARSNLGNKIVSLWDHRRKETAVGSVAALALICFFCLFFL